MRDKTFTEILLQLYKRDSWEKAAVSRLNILAKRAFGEIQNSKHFSAAHADIISLARGFFS